jgi:hypothetical protein
MIQRAHAPCVNVEAFRKFTSIEGYRLKRNMRPANSGMDATDRLEALQNIVPILV